mmetsp:Transcript_11676/g.27016  ORF Transcript_11676/g.27016 Transcript_11676/m.27016 type:complete len:121 (-) Transcript_11676:9-371(-)
MTVHQTQTCTVETTCKNSTTLVGEVSFAMSGPGHSVCSLTVPPRDLERHAKLNKSGEAAEEKNVLSPWGLGKSNAVLDGGCGFSGNKTRCIKVAIAEGKRGARYSAHSCRSIFSTNPSRS